MKNQWQVTAEMSSTQTQHFTPFVVYRPTIVEPLFETPGLPNIKGLKYVLRPVAADNIDA